MIKKILKVVFITVFLLLLLLIAGVFIFIKTFDINRYKPQIIAQVNSALGRSFDFKEMALTVSWRDGIRLRLQDLVMGDHPAFQKGDFMFLPASLGGFEIQTDTSCEIIKTIVT